MFLFEDGSLAQTGYGGSNQMADDDAETAYTPQTVLF